MTSTLENLIQRLGSTSEAVTEKTAGVQPPAMPSTSTAVEAAIAGLEPKTAGAPTESLEKMAQDLLANEAALSEKQAQALGAALCDGFAARMAAYDSVFATKTASVHSQLDAEMIQKIAADATAAAIAHFEKQAHVDFQQGWDDYVKQAFDLGTQIHLEGQASVQGVIKALAEGTLG